MALKRIAGWRWLSVAGPIAFGLVGIAPLKAQDTAAVRERQDSVAVRFVDADLRAVVQALGRYLPKPVVVAGLPGTRVSLDTQGPVPRGRIAALLRGLLESQNLLYEADSALIRIGVKPEGGGRTVGRSDSQSDTAQVQLFVIRLRHARAARCRVHHQPPLRRKWRVLWKEWARNRNPLRGTPSPTGTTDSPPVRQPARPPV